MGFRLKLDFAAWREPRLQRPVARRNRRVGRMVLRKERKDPRRGVVDRGGETGRGHLALALVDFLAGRRAVFATSDVVLARTEPSR